MWETQRGRIAMIRTRLKAKRPQTICTTSIPVLPRYLAIASDATIREKPQSAAAIASRDGFFSGDPVVQRSPARQGVYRDRVVCVRSDDVDSDYSGPVRKSRTICGH